MQSLILFLAYGSVSFNQDTPIIELYSNTEGTFEFSLDGEDYKQCMQLIYLRIYILHKYYHVRSYILEENIAKFANLEENFLPLFSPLKFCH